MYVLYGTKRKYKKDVIRNGITHNSAAYFLIPEKQEYEKIQTTLACAIYHAIGISTLKNAIVNYEKLSASIVADTGIVLIVFYLNDDLLLCEREEYYVEDAQTYSYVKIRNAGIVSMDYIGCLDIDEAYFDEYINADSIGSRFFQKKGGKTQYIKNCNMQKLKLCCLSAAATNLKLFTDLLKG